MGKNKLKYCWWLGVLAFVCSVTTASAQYESGAVNVSFSLPSIALVDIEPEGNNDVLFQMDTYPESGYEPTVREMSSQALWLNYSSSLAIGGGTRTIMAEIAGGTLPNGITLSVSASIYSGIGGGALGVPVGEVQLSYTPKAIVTDIGNCYTGDGVGNGHELVFSVKYDNFAQLQAVGQSQVVVLYTLSDN